MRIQYSTFELNFLFFGSEPLLKSHTCLDKHFLYLYPVSKKQRYFHELHNETVHILFKNGQNRRGRTRTTISCYLEKRLGAREIKG